MDTFSGSPELAIGIAAVIGFMIIYILVVVTIDDFKKNKKVK